MPAPDRPPSTIVRTAVLLATVLAASLAPLLWPVASTAATSTATGSTSGTVQGTTTTSGGIGSCEQNPPMASFVRATSTSLTFAITWTGPNCGFGGGGRLTLNTSKTFAGAVVVAISPGTNVTVPNLTPGTAYYWGTQGSSPVSSGWQGPATTLAATSTTTTTLQFCDPIPPALTYLSATSSSLTFSYQSHGAACGDTDDVIVHVRLPGASTETKTIAVPAQSGTVTVTGLAAATSYQYGASGGGSPFGTSWYGTATTLGGPSTSTTDGGNGCSASYTALSDWTGNFMATLAVTNVSPLPFTGWRVTWTWPGGQSLVAAYSATAGGSSAQPVVTNPSWGGKIQPGGKAETVLMGAGTPPATAPALTCTVLN